MNDSELNDSDITLRLLNTVQARAVLSVLLKSNPHKALSLHEFLFHVSFR